MYLLACLRLDPFRRAKARVAAERVDLSTAGLWTDRKKSLDKAPCYLLLKASPLKDEGFAGVTGGLSRLAS